jgi:hypothetical protein
MPLRSGAAQAPYATWRDYKGSPDSSNYSALKQINRSNVGRLVVAWSYNSHDTMRRPAAAERGQMGLRLVRQKRPMPLIKVDQIERQPTANEASWLVPRRAPSGLASCS